MKKKFFLVLFLCFGLFIGTLFFGQKANAATLASVSDTITTSRPSASAPVSANVAASDESVTVDSNGSTFLASDSAKFWGQTQETLTVATTSANKLTLFFTGQTAQAHTKGTAISTAITAVHTVTFTLISSIPAAGSIYLKFPSAVVTDAQQASPSASTFMFNGLTNTNVKFNNVTCGTTTVTANSGATQPTIICDNITNGVAGGTIITALLGCSTAGSSCAIANQVPTIINPTKTAATGTADTWTMQINSYSGTTGTGTSLDNARIKIGTVESVSVVAHVDPTFSFTIAGLGATQALNTAGTCTVSHAADTANTLYATTATDVNLGTLVSTQVNRTHQQLTISSNSIGGYTITATASGHLVNPANGYFIPNAQGDATANETPIPAAIAQGTAAFGIHACDANSKVTTTGKWEQSPAKFANPAPVNGTSSGYYYTLVSSGVAPASTGDNIFVEYAATVAGSTPAGDYQTVLTYVATPIF